MKNEAIDYRPTDWDCIHCGQRLFMSVGMIMQILGEDPRVRLLGISTLKPSCPECAGVNAFDLETGEQLSDPAAL